MSDLSLCTGDEWITLIGGVEHIEGARCTPEHTFPSCHRFCKSCETDRWFMERYKKSYSKDTERDGRPCLGRSSVYYTKKEWVTSLPVRCPTNMLTNRRHMVCFQVELRPDHCMVCYPNALYASVHQSARWSIQPGGVKDRLERGGTQSHQRKTSREICWADTS